MKLKMIRVKKQSIGKRIIVIGEKLARLFGYLTMVMFRTIYSIVSLAVLRVLYNNFSPVHKLYFDNSSVTLISTGIMIFYFFYYAYILEVYDE